MHRANAYFGGDGPLARTLAGTFAAGLPPAALQYTQASGAATYPLSGASLHNRRCTPLAIRLKDIAADLGVSAVTVSKVLRGKSDVGEETRQRVMERVRAVNYQPNLLARGLASGKSQTIGLIVPDLLHTFFAEFAKGLKAGLRKRGYQLILASAEEEPQLEREEIDVLLARGVDALLLATCQPEADALASLAAVQVPCVLVDRALPASDRPFVGTDDAAAGCVATEHLLKMGRRRIAHIAGEEFSTGRDRLAGYREALMAATIEPRPEWVMSRLRLEEAGERIGKSAMAELLALPEQPDAVFCYNDLAAMGAVQAVLEAGLRVPEDVAVVGCGNLRVSDYLRVPLTTIDQSTAEQGEQAAKLALSLLSGKAKTPGRQVRIAPKLVVRASTGTT